MEFPVVALLGPRQAGKTTLAWELARSRGEHVYLDLERDADLNKLSDPDLYLSRQFGKLTILDEVQRKPELFRLLRTLVDDRIRNGEPAGHFLVLGSASRDLLRQSSESLAGRIRYLELAPFTTPELTGQEIAEEVLWLRGGYPGSLLATSDGVSWDWRTSFVSTYLERDIPQLGPRLPAEQLRRFWMMLANQPGAPLNAARLAGGLGVSGNTVRHYLDVLTELYMVRQLSPWAGNSAKRLVRSPRVYVRDSGLTHRLANIPDLETLLGHPVCGPSWEGHVVENLLVNLPDAWTAFYYRSRGGAEIDLVLEGPGPRTIAVEIKRSLSPKLTRGYREGFIEVGAERGYVVVPAGEPHPLDSKTEVVPLREMVTLVRGWK